MLQEVLLLFQQKPITIQKGLQVEQGVSEFLLKSLNFLHREPFLYHQLSYQVESNYSDNYYRQQLRI